MIAAIAAAAATGVASVAVFSALKLLSDMAVKKELPKQVHKMKINVSGSEKPDAILISAAARKAALLREKCTEKITIKNRDGLTLTGHWLRCEKPKRIVIAMHGWRSCWDSDFSLISDFFLSSGCSVLFPDQRAHGESEGEHIGFGAFERYDCYDWVNYVIENEPQDIPIYLCGISMGATTVLMTAGLDLPERVKGIIADCGFTSPKDIWQHVMNNNLKIKGTLALNIASFYISREAKMQDVDVSTVDALKNTRTPILFIHGDKDTFVPIDMTYKNYENCASEKSLLVVADAEHGLSYFVDAITYKKTVCEFFDKYDN